MHLRAVRVSWALGAPLRALRFEAQVEWANRSENCGDSGLHGGGDSGMKGGGLKGGVTASLTLVPQLLLECPSSATSATLRVSTPHHTPK